MVKVILDKQKRNTSFKDNIPEMKQVYEFLKRHPDLSDRRSQALGKERAIVTIEQIIDWFDGLRMYLSDDDALDGLDNTTRMHNADECGCPLATSGERVLVLLVMFQHP